MLVQNQVQLLTTVTDGLVQILGVTCILQLSLFIASLTLLSFGVGQAQHC